MNNDALRAKQYWRANIRLVLSLLAIWAFVSFGCGILLVDVLNQITFFGFKLGFWFAHQGAIYVFVVLIFVYVWRINILDKRYGVDEGDE
ncbi:DUF4212 domain-containing protein [Shewanella surugensis]|uniref:DUF4212 domain-containing protein n=1 Tax=Shewanella surugensis TaxID=212020 RepID=A0ABT0LHN5_9GAMM|nr:DUF4212 domain-containing protein [Shewanella surugensis]MCL1127211.1 DUF4212 domain-containing protein [Shewanella surugensis]